MQRIENSSETLQWLMYVSTSNNAVIWDTQTILSREGATWNFVFIASMPERMDKTCHQAVIALQATNFAHGM